MQSILQTDRDKCFVCGYWRTEEHHIYFGRNRKVSDRHGFTVYLCAEHHRGTNGVHGKNGHALDQHLKELCQEAYEIEHSREEFISLIGRSYL